MLLPSQHRELTETYRQVYLGEVDDITDVMIEEVVEELIEEFVEFGYELDEAAEAVEEAATEYLMELNPYAPAGSKEARAYQKSTTSTKRGEARKAAVKGAVARVKATAKSVKAAAGIAGSIAKDEARRAGRAAAHSAGKAASAAGSAVKGAATAVHAAASAKKAEVKKGVKSLLGKGLRKAAGAAGAVAQKARKAGAAAGRAAERLGEEADLFDYILEYLVAEGYADTNEAALVIMTNMSEEWRNEIVEETLTEKLAKGTKGVSFSTGRHAGGFDQAMTEKNPKTGRQRKTSPLHKAWGAHSKAKAAQWKAENEGDHEAAARHKKRRDTIAHVVYNKTNRIIDRADND